jgi:hypothetical protein
MSNIIDMIWFGYYAHCIPVEKEGVFDLPGVIANYLRGGVEGVANLFTCDSRCTWVIRETHRPIVSLHKTADPDNEKYKYYISSMSLRLLGL